MEVLIFSGGGSVGKTSALQRIKKILESNGYHLTAELPFNPNEQNFTIVMEKLSENGSKKRVFLNSWSDTLPIIRRAYEKFTQVTEINVVITASREMGIVRQTMFNLFPFDEYASNVWEIPLGKVLKGRSRSIGLQWHATTLDDLSEKIMSLPSFDLI